MKNFHAELLLAQIPAQSQLIGGGDLQHATLAAQRDVADAQDGIAALVGVREIAVELVFGGKRQGDVGQGNDARRPGAVERFGRRRARVRLIEVHKKMLHLIDEMEAMRREEIPVSGKNKVSP